ncbi:hypothetical protein K1T71_014105 [Dendrolimus kikuchii]|uniref:Uncharacterized protein n=1 Tax=Dendrolimus kikuchii TaxID=765133 RepID=A0ACC1CF23_9NEOP|nr:hypothetical protein K1T71_014105 [Dendrolimus kikuchii]
MDFDKDIMHDSRKDELLWESTVRLIREEEFGMFLEEREGRKRKWPGEKMRRDGSEDKEQRKVPPKKVMAALGDMGGSGTSSSSSHMSPGWHVNDLDIDLPGELSMNEALLALPSLTSFKQEAPSPTGNVLSPPRRAWPQRRADDRQITNMVVDNVSHEGMEDGRCQQSPTHNGNMMVQHDEGTILNSSSEHSPLYSAGLLMCSPVSSLDGFLQSPIQARSDAVFKDDTRFQYVLAAATSIATKQNEETLTYLNQGQPYEIKLKKLGDLAHYKGKILKSVIKICFHERRLQYMEKEQIQQWHAERPGERIVEVDVPLSYGVIRVEQPCSLNALHVYWDPTKDVGVYIKVNCISTEFTAKKHGGEKGVPFRIQVETYLASDDDNRLHAAACQIKVFKLKGADRKHKQDREKVMRRPRSDLEKFQPGCEATVLSTLSNDALLPPPSLITASPPYSPEMCVTPKSAASPISSKPALTQPALHSMSSQMKTLYSQDGNDMKVSAPSCQSPDAILPDLPQPAEDPDKNCGLSKEATSSETQAWLARNRFAQHAATFANFSGADLLRLSRDDIIQICGLADGIRLFNALHAKRIEPRLTLYVCAAGSNIYSALYLHACRAHELLHKLRSLVQGNAAKECESVLVSGPNGALVRLSDELVRHLPDNSTYRLERVEDQNSLLLSATNN